VPSANSRHSHSRSNFVSSSLPGAFLETCRAQRPRL
jgi:hypothetical protein